MHRSLEQLETDRAHILAAPQDGGPVEMIVRRPSEDEREVVDSATLDPEVGLVGDNWRARGNPFTEDGRAHPLTQLTLMNSRVAAAVAQTRERWPLAGDQLYVDLDVSEGNLPAGTRLIVGGATLEITAQPHTGCAKFSDRFGADALRFVNIGPGREQRLRGVYAVVVEGGDLSVGDLVRKA